MTYSIGEVSKKFNISASTLRYYEKEGLLPFIERKSSGIRTFTDLDISWLEIIHCLKNSGMPIKDIKVFIEWSTKGDSTLQERYDMFLERKKSVENQIEMLQKTLNVVNYKCWYYKKALDAGTEKIHKDIEPGIISETILNGFEFSEEDN